jgi:sugar phosphate isomerase/epimerase
LAVRNIRQLQRDTAVRIAVETFGGPKRVLTPEEVGEREIWMVLDTSHLFEDRIFALIERYHGTIAGVHLSEMRKDKTTGEMRPHMPVEGYGIDVLERLRAKGWQGTVTLEYLPDYHGRLLPDRQALEGLFPRI